MNPQNWGPEVALKTLLNAIVKRMSLVWSATSVLANTMDSHRMILKDVRYYCRKQKKESNPYTSQPRGEGRLGWTKVFIIAVTMWSEG